MAERIYSSRDLALVELLDRVLHKGAVLSADITLSVSDIDLVYVSLRAMIASTDTARKLSGGDAFELAGSG